MKCLIIRFSSFGDVVQTMGVADSLKANNPDVKVHFVTRKSFSEIVKLNSNVDKIEVFDRSLGFSGLLKFFINLRKEKFDLVYDAHSNLRSLFAKLILLGPFFFISKKLKVRSKNRFKRLLLFRFRKNYFSKPFYARSSFLEPLNLEVAEKTNWKFPELTIKKIDKVLPEISFVALVLGASWDLKIWPKKRWSELIQKNKDQNFVLLGGNLEKSVADQLEQSFPGNLINLVGKLNLIESSYALSKSKIFISGDTGLLHVGDSLNIPGYALIGPTAFGYPLSKNVQTLEDKSLHCRPCSKDGRGSCSQEIHKKCMVNITPEMIHL